MNTTTDTAKLHAIRRAQLMTLHHNRAFLRNMERPMVDKWAELCGAYYDTRNLSDKSLEEIDTLASKYLERVK